MFGFSRKTDYALLMVTALARRRGEFVPVRTVADAHHLPYRFASEILGSLARWGILEAREGAKGGYRLARDAQAVTVADVLQATEGGTALVSCQDAKVHFACPQKAWCRARTGIGALRADLLRTLSRHTIADFVRAQSEASHVS